jgi:hypothetical protein
LGLRKRPIYTCIWSHPGNTFTLTPENIMLNELAAGLDSFYLSDIDSLKY